MFLPREIIAVEVISRVWPRSVRTGVIRVGRVDPEEEGVGSSAGRIESEKSAPADRRTREEGKN